MYVMSVSCSWSGLDLIPALLLVERSQRGWGVAKMATDGRMTGGRVESLNLSWGGMAERTMATVLKTAAAPGGVGEMLTEAPPRIVNGVTWAFAPDMLTLEEACYLSGYDRGFMLQVIEADGVDLDNAGRIEKKSLWEWLEVSVELAH
jgi:hypothetical protein